MFEILLVLLNKKKVTSTELAKMFEVSVRTIYRDIDELSLAGIPIYTEAGRQGGIYLDKNYVMDRFIVTSQEQSDILFALRCIETIPNMEAGELFKKLSALFGKNSNIQESTWLDVDFRKWNTESKDDELFFYQLKEAIVSQKAVQIRYVNQKGQETSRILDPIKLIYKNKGWYLYAYCKLRQSFRLFKLKLILQCDILQQKADIYTDVPNPYINNYKDVTNMKYLKLIFLKAVISRVFENFEHQYIKRYSKDYISVSGNFEINEWLYSLLLSFGPNVFVEEPVNVRQELYNRHLESTKFLMSKDFQ
jgi:predicted DNA-binding transcriptional regulator YafY